MIQNAGELKRLVEILSKNEERYDIEKIIGAAPRKPTHDTNN